MNNDLISREALKETIDSITWYHINPYGELIEGAHSDSDALFKAEDIFKTIDNAPTVETPTELCKGCRFLKDCETCEEKIRPQGDIRWTDKLSITSSGDIIDFEGRVVGHINLEDVKGGAE